VLVGGYANRNGKGKWPEKWGIYMHLAGGKYIDKYSHTITKPRTMSDFTVHRNLKFPPIFDLLHNINHPNIC